MRLRRARMVLASEREGTRDSARLSLTRSFAASAQVTRRHLHNLQRLNAVAEERRSASRVCWPVYIDSSARGFSVPACVRGQCLARRHLSRSLYSITLRWCPIPAHAHLNLDSSAARLRNMAVLFKLQYYQEVQ